MIVGSDDCTVGNKVRPTRSKICPSGSALRPTGEKFWPGRKKIRAIGKKGCAIGKNVRAIDANDCTTGRKVCEIHKKLTEAHTSARWRQSRRRDWRARPARTHHASKTYATEEDAMNNKLTWILQWARRRRDFLVAHEPKNVVAERASLRMELDDPIEQLTGRAATHEAITKQSGVQTRRSKRLRSGLRDGKMRPIVRMIRTMKRVINNTEKALRGR